MTGVRANLNLQAKFFEADIRSEAAEKAIQDLSPDVINHHATQMDVRKSMADPVYDCEVNGIAMLRLLEAGRKVGVRKFIFSSSGGAVYGEQQSFPVDEQLRSCIASEKIQLALGWRPRVSLKEGIEQTVAYFRGLATRVKS